MGKKKPPITREQLSAYYHLPIAEVAHELGMCPTLLKRICRRVGIARWPYRKLRSIDRTVAALEQALWQRRQPQQQVDDSTTATTEELEQELVLLHRRRQRIVEDTAPAPTVVPSSPPCASSCITTATTTTTTTTTTATPTATPTASTTTECDDGDDGMLPRRWRTLVQCPDTGAVRAVYRLPPLTLPPVAQ